MGPSGARPGQGRAGVPPSTGSGGTGPAGDTAEEGAGPALSVDRLAATLSDGDRRFSLEAGPLSLAPGEAVALAGASGSGKTLLLELLGLLRPPSPGCAWRIAAAGQGNLAALWDDPAGRRRLPGLRGRHLGFVPQSGGLLGFLTARENAALSQSIAGRPDPARIDRLLDRLGIADVAGLPATRLSIGQRQRVALARALAHRPAVLLSDEPTAALDPENARTAMALMIETAREEGAALILSCHDHALIEAFGLPRIALATQAAGDGAVLSRLEPVA